MSLRFLITRFQARIFVLLASWMWAWLDGIRGDINLFVACAEVKKRTIGSFVKLQVAPWTVHPWKQKPHPPIKVVTCKRHLALLVQIELQITVAIFCKCTQNHVEQEKHISPPPLSRYNSFSPSPSEAGVKS